MSVVHEGENLHRISLWNLTSVTPKDPNPYWIHVEGQPVESWKGIGNARFYFNRHVEFRRRHNCRMEVCLYLLLPWLGLILLERETS